MTSVNFGKNIKGVDKELGWQYNWEHVVFVTKQRKKNFKKEYNREVVRAAIAEAAAKFGIEIKEFSFGDDFAHVHMELDIPNTLSVIQVIQILKSHSASVIFQKIPNFRKLYPRGSFWGYQYSDSSVGPVGEHIIQNYIRRQDISQKYSEKQRQLFN
jgi:REP element-mobilizing transposase RayT